MEEKGKKLNQYLYQNGFVVGDFFVYFIYLFIFFNINSISIKLTPEHTTKHPGLLSFSMQVYLNTGFHQTKADWRFSIKRYIFHLQAKHSDKQTLF